MSNDELRERVEIMRLAGVRICRDGETEIELFAPDLLPENDNNDTDADRRRRERHTYGGK